MLCEIVSDHFRLFLIDCRCYELFQVLFDFGCFVSFQSRSSSLTLHSVVLRCFTQFSAACRCSMCFVVLRCFRFVFVSHFSVRFKILNVVQIEIGWFFFDSGCYIGYFNLLMLCGSLLRLLFF